MGAKGGELPFEEQYLTFEALEDTTFSISIPMEYSLDNGTTWASLESDTATPIIHEGEKILWKKTATTISKQFTSTGTFNVYGNILSVLYGDSFVGKNIFPNGTYHLAYLLKATGVVDASNLILPTTSLAYGCYRELFYNCASLIAAPAIPATSVSTDCCRSMFGKCGNLTTAPALLSPVLATRCYQSMFSYCASLSYIKCLATTISATNCLDGWVGGVSNTGTFVKDANMNNWTIGGSGIPSGWEVIDA